MTEKGLCHLRSVAVSISQGKSFSGAYRIVFIAGLTWTAYRMAGSPGWAFDDELAHFYVSRDAWAQPWLILDYWGRPFQTLFFMPAALFGFGTARWCALAASSLTVVIASLWAQKLGLRRLAFVPFCLWFQPWFSDFAYTANTMTPFALLLVLGAYWISIDRTRAAALAFGLLPLARHEGLGLTLLLLAYLIYKRRYSSVLVAIMPMCVYTTAYYLYAGSIPLGALIHYDVQDVFVAPLNPSVGLWLYYLPAVVRGAGVPLLACGALSLICIVRSPFQSGVPFVFYGAYLAVHVMIVRYGLFSGVRNDFYLVPLAPALGVAAALGFDTAFSALRHWVARHGKPRLRHLPAVAVGVGAIAVLGVAVQAALHPFITSEIRVKRTEEKLAKRAAEWIKDHAGAGRPIYTTDVRIRYFLSETSPQKARSLIYVSGETPLEELPNGAIFVWDRHYSEAWGYHLKNLMSDTSVWRKLMECGESGEVYAIVFEQTKT